MKHWIIAALYTGMVFGAANAANIALEPPITPTANHTIVTRAIRNDDGAEAFTLDAAEEDTSFIFNLWDSTTILLNFSTPGDSVDCMLRFFSGVTKPSAADITKSDFSTFMFVLKDSLQVTGEGNMSRAISTALLNAPYGYMTATMAETGNDSTLTITGYVIREK